MLYALARSTGSAGSSGSRLLASPSVTDSLSTSLSLAGRTVSSYARDKYPWIKKAAIKKISDQTVAVRKSNGKDVIYQIISDTSPKVVNKIIKEANSLFALGEDIENAFEKAAANCGERITLSRFALHRGKMC